MTLLVYAVSFILLACIINAILDWRIKRLKAKLKREELRKAQDDAFKLYLNIRERLIAQVRLKSDLHNFAVKQRAAYNQDGRLERVDSVTGKLIGRN